jgi:signal transduction histidine kinase
MDAALSLAKRVTTVLPSTICGEVYELMARDETIFALPVIEKGIPCGLADRVVLMSQFARPYWREIYSKQPITKLMDPMPVVVDVTSTVEAIGAQIAARRQGALDAAFILSRDGAYFGIGSTVDLLQLMADRALQRQQELAFAQAEIQALNQSLELRVNERTKELEAAQQELVRRERLSTLGQLTATVAHEMRNPLSAIRNSLFVLCETLRDNPTLSRPLARMDRSIKRCDKIIEELLDYTQVSELRPRPVAIDTWLEEVLSELEIPEGIVIARDFCGGSSGVEIDPERMRQVIINLIENATHALADASGVRRIVVGTRIAAETLRLEVADTGPGIPEDVLPKVFEPLFSTKSFGTGLGLPLVKRIIEQHNGAIGIESQPGSGTRVAISLPRVVKSKAAA